MREQPATVTPNPTPHLLFAAFPTRPPGRLGGGALVTAKSRKYEKMYTAWQRAGAPRRRQRPGNAWGCQRRGE